MINKDTKIFGSFAAQAGNVGCRFFNSKFKELEIDAIYKSYSVANIEEAVLAARCLGFAGFAVSMPYKVKILDCVDEISDEARKIKAANTVISKNQRLVAYNTDYHAATKVLLSCENNLFILGNGGYACAVKQAAEDLRLSYENITRKNWDKIYEIKNSTIFNCTPVKNLILDSSNNFIDCDVDSPTGRNLAELQAHKQFELYTGIKI